MRTLSIRFLVKKVLYMLASLWIVITLTFFLMKALPGDPFSEEQPLPKEIHEALLSYYGLDQPLWKQYTTYIYSISRGDLGPSYKYKNRTVNEIIKEYFPVSAYLGIEALLLAIGTGVLLGTLAALKENRWQDHLTILFTALGVSIPSFILAALLQYVFALKWHLLPLARWETFAHTILPAITLALLPTAFITRLMRASMIEVLKCDYIKTAKAKGLSMNTILRRHALKNASLPTLSYLGQLITNVLTGSFIIEKIFSIPGLGQWFVNSVNNRDYSVIMGLTIFYSVLLMLIILLIDIAYGFLDPRIQLEKNT